MHRHCADDVLFTLRFIASFAGIIKIFAQIFHTKCIYPAGQILELEWVNEWMNERVREWVSEFKQVKSFILLPILLNDVKGHYASFSSSLIIKFITSFKMIAQLICVFKHWDYYIQMKKAAAAVTRCMFRVIRFVLCCVYSCASVCVWQESTMLYH